MGNGGPVTKVVASGEPAPTGVFDSFRQPGIADGQVAFWATYDGATQEGIFSEAGGILTAVAKNGDVGPLVERLRAFRPTDSQGRRSSEIPSHFKLQRHLGPAST